MPKRKCHSDSTLWKQLQVHVEGYFTQVRQGKNSLWYNSHTRAQLVTIKKSTIFFLEETKLLSGCSNSTVLGVGFFTLYSCHPIPCKASRTGRCSTVHAVSFCTTHQRRLLTGGPVCPNKQHPGCFSTSLEECCHPGSRAEVSEGRVRGKRDWVVLPLKRS